MTMTTINARSLLDSSLLCALLGCAFHCRSLPSAFVAASVVPATQRADCSIEETVSPIPVSGERG
jgi:hypothetical protein